MMQTQTGYFATEVMTQANLVYCTIDEVYSV